jgi:hypothetical protein
MKVTVDNAFKKKHIFFCNESSNIQKNYEIAQTKPKNLIITVLNYEKSILYVALFLKWSLLFCTN